MPLTARLRKLIAGYGLYIAVILAILGVVAIGSAAMTYANPPTKTETFVTSQQEFSTRVDTSMTVVNNTTLYAENEKLRNMPAYFFDASSNLTYHIRVKTPPDVKTTVRTRLVLHLEGTRNGETFWQQRELLAFENTTSTGTTWTNTTVNISAMQSLIGEKRDAIGGVGALSVRHRLNVTYNSNSQNKFSGTLTSQAPLVTTTSAFWIDGSISASRTHSKTDTRRFRKQPNFTRILLLAFLGTLLFTVAASVAINSRAYDVDDIREQIAREEYEEWISNGEIPTKSEKEYIRVDSIEDVVDIAIDSNKRVIYDKSLDVYAVVEGDLVYFYTTDTEGISDWLDL